jgi:hypothetical protein
MEAEVLAQYTDLQLCKYYGLSLSDIQGMTVDHYNTACLAMAKDAHFAKLNQPKK